LSAVRYLRIGVSLFAFLTAGAGSRLASSPDVLPTTIRASAFSNGARLLAGATIRSKVVSYHLDAAKETRVGGVTYWVVPAGGNNLGYWGFGVFEVNAGRLVLLANVPATDEPTKYGFGSNLAGRVLTLERPYDRPNQKCCKLDKNYEYQIMTNKIKLVRVYFSPELP